jgi:hypothetical protein
MKPIVLAWVLAMLGCSSSAEIGASGFPSEPLMTLPSDSGNLRIEVRTSPQQPPSRGLLSVQLVIRDAMTNAPRPGFTVQAVPWMPAHAHGASLQPSVAEAAPGIYILTNVDFFMPGTWELRTSLSGTTTDHVEPSFEIP